MSTREMAVNIIDNFTDEQLEAFVIMFGSILENDREPNEETLEALEEVRDMKMNPEKYKGYDDVDAMFKELLS